MLRGVKSVFFVFVFCVVFSFLQGAQAQTFSVDNIFDFGEAVDKGSASRSRITLSPDGSYTADSAFIFISTPTPGHVTFTGGPASTNFTVSFSPTRFWLDGQSGSGRRFRINNLTSGPAALMTDALGNGEFFIGGRLNTRRIGTGSYPDDAYTGSVDVTVTFIP